jgi:hypothetical protein
MRLEATFNIYKARIIYGGYPADWRLIRLSHNLDEVNDFLELENLLPLYGGGAVWGTEPDSMGCSDIYRIEVQLQRSV